MRVGCLIFGHHWKVVITERGVVIYCRRCPVTWDRYVVSRWSR